MKALTAVLILFSSLAPAKSPECREDQLVQLLIQNMRERDSISCEKMDGAFIQCKSAAGLVSLDLIVDRNAITAEGYWSYSPRPDSAVWVQIQLTAEAREGRCLTKDYSFGAAVED